eukprot:scaffold4936_cov73-Phaeocystis_antarctica.AAC.10
MPVVCEPTRIRLEHLADAAVHAVCTIWCAEGEDQRSYDSSQGTFDEPFRLCCESIGAFAGLERKRTERPTRSPQLLHHSHDVCVDLKTGLRCKLPDYVLLEGGDQLGIELLIELGHHPARTGHVEHDAAKVLTDASTRNGPRCTCAALAPTSFVNWAVFATSSSIDAASSSLVTVGSSRLPSRPYESVLRTSEPEKPPCSLVTTTREQPVKACWSNLTCGAGAEEFNYVRNAVCRVYDVQCGARKALACAGSRLMPPWSSITTEK